jgi:hypothetical protein
MESHIFLACNFSMTQLWHETRNRCGIWMAMEAIVNTSRRWRWNAIQTSPRKQHGLYCGSIVPEEPSTAGGKSKSNTSRNMHHFTPVLAGLSQSEPSCRVTAAGMDLISEVCSFFEERQASLYYCVSRITLDPL